MSLFSNFAPYLQNFWENIFPQIVYWVDFTAIVWLPAILIRVAWGYWVKYVRRAWISKQDKVLLEIKLPQETYKSPEAMEFFFISLYQTFGETTPIMRYWKGQVRPWFSLEIASHGGSIHFYVWCFKSTLIATKAGLYAQFPEVEIHEVEDYTKKMVYDEKTHNMFAAELTLTKPDPYPIKTYVDYGMKADTEEQYKIDPLSSLIELIGTLQPGNEFWLQILIRAHKKEKTLFNTDLPDAWKDEAKTEIQKIIDEAKDEEGHLSIAKMTKGRAEIIASIERSATKYPFDTGIRCIYITEQDKFNPAYIGGVVGALKHFNSNSLNGFKPSVATGFDYWWQDPFKRRIKIRKYGLYKFYTKRAFFHFPPARTPFVLNTEELATIFHFPGSVVKTPTLGRIPSKRADAPSNLPI